MTWLKDDFERLKTLRGADQHALTEYVGHFWNSLRAQLIADVNEYNNMIANENPEAMVTPSEANPQRIQFSYRDGPGVKIYYDLEARSVRFLYDSDNSELAQSISITRAVADFPALSQLILRPFLFPRLVKQD